MDLYEIGERAKSASRETAKLTTAKKNEVLLTCADALEARMDYILEENAKDVAEANRNGMDPGLVDRLLLTEDRIQGMAAGLRQIAALEDPVGEVLSMKKRPNGLLIGKKRVPLGVVGIIYEARPNVTSDVFGLCFKAGNAAILKGGSDAINSNIAVAGLLRDAAGRAGVNSDVIQLIEDTSHEATEQLMRLNGFVDVLIPRGGAALIRSVVDNATVPVIETGSGNCHVFVDKTADIDMAVKIILNAKTQRIGVCNACESIVVHKDIEEKLLPVLGARLAEKNVEMRADEEAAKYIDGAVLAEESDWGKEYLALKVSIKTVSGIDEAIDHINKYSTGHSETIVTNDYTNAQRFLDEVDSAVVYVNASTRFSDGGEFGFGGEIGISTQKLHARGPMGLEALTTTKYIVYGNGQTRP
jgi:glutamate-5-semialdehyde dehydrogenase